MPARWSRALHPERARRPRSQTLNTNVHFHALVAEEVFATAPDGAVRFMPAARPPTDLEVGRLLATVRRRIVRLVRRRGIALDRAEADAGIADGLALAAMAGAVIGRVATGPRAGHHAVRLGADATAPVVVSGGPRHAHRDGFDLHADTAAREGERRRLVRHGPSCQFASSYRLCAALRDALQVPLVTGRGLVR